MSPDAHPHGLDLDLDRLVRQQASRRRLLAWLVAGGAGVAGTAVLSACGGGGADGSTGTTTGGGGTGTGSGGSCSVIPEETNGPYPGDGSNGLNVLTTTGIVRSDLRTSIGSSARVAGVPMTLKIQLVDTGDACAGLEGYAIYAWHCSADGLYSMYSNGVTDQTWLRGVQATDSTGLVTFTTIVPGCYTGRMPHVHFEVYRSLATATSSSNRLKTSQIAFPTDVCDAVYALEEYGSSANSFAQISFATDNVFSDGYSTQLATMTGDVTNGYVATLEVGIAA